MASGANQRCDKLKNVEQPGSSYIRQLTTGVHQ